MEQINDGTNLFSLLQAYLVFKYKGKEQPQTTMSRGSKYMAAPKSTSTVLSTVASSGNTATVGDRLSDDLEYSSPLEKDIQVCICWECNAI